MLRHGTVPCEAVSAGAWRGMNSSAITATAQQPTMYQLIPVREPVCSTIAAAMSGAGPPAITEAS